MSHVSCRVAATSGKWIPLLRVKTNTSPRDAERVEAKVTGVRDVSPILGTLFDIAGVIW
jgi:hypothetical protein